MSSESPFSPNPTAAPSSLVSAPAHATPNGASFAAHPYADFVQKMEKPARYLGGEFGARPKPWAEVDARICLAFPDIYDIGMSHLGFKILYKILNDDTRTLAERAYMPWVDLRAELRTRGVPLVSLESARPLVDFDVVGFSLQFELTYTNVLAMLELGGIPLRSEARGEEHPLVIAGGPTATHPEPLAPFLDAIVIGDGEERTTEVALLWTALRKQGLSRRQRLVELAKLRGVYVPSLYSTRIDAATGFTVVDAPLEPGVPAIVERSVVANLDDYPFPDDGPVGGPEAIFDRMSIEIARGCTEGCRFCQAGMIYRPVRERDPEKIVETVVSAVKKAGYDEASLTSLSTADYSCIAPLVKKVVDRLAPEKVSLGVSSLRAYGLEENVLDDLQRVRASGVTFAPEAGSQRMRDVVNKNVTEEQLTTTAERVFSRGWNSMKLYFMIGLPTEEEDDVREIVRVGKRARDVGKRIKKERFKASPPNVTVSVSTHVPKPHTPFQWCAMDEETEVRQKQRWLKEEARYAKGVELKVHDSRTSWLEGVFARGDRTLANVLERAYHAGAVFDSWEEHLKLGVWEEAFREEGVDPRRFLGTLPVTARLPWDHIDVGLEEGFLLSEYRKALKSRLSPPCGKVAGAFVQASNLQDARKETKKLVCYDCGVACDLDAMRHERLVYLGKLGAEEPRPPTPLPEIADRPAPKAPAAFVQGEPVRYRFAYTKTGPSAFLSHLDLIRALPRVFRRLDIPMYYTRGFHPKPDMTFGPALSLGVFSVAEVIDMKLVGDFDVDQLVRSLREAAPAGVEFVAGVRLGERDPAVGKLLSAQDYVLAIPNRALADKPAGWLAERLAHLEAREEAVVMRKIEGIGKKVDVKKHLVRIALEGGEWLERAGLIGDFTAITVQTRFDAKGAVKISEVAEVLFDDPALPWRAVRTRLGAYDEAGQYASPMDLAVFRLPPKPSLVAEPAETGVTA